MQRLEDFRALIKENNDNEKENTDYERCLECSKRGQTCCQAYLCEISPKDLKEVTRESILKLLDTGFVVLDCWDGDLNWLGFHEYSRVWFLRMRAKNDVRAVSFTYGGECAALINGEGCIVDFKHRPLYGRIGDCKSTVTLSSKQRASEEWREYYDILNEVAEELKPWQIHQQLGYDDLNLLQRLILELGL